MIMEDFVTFEIAKKLKEKGFREKCLLHYEATGGVYSNSIDTYDRPNQELDYSDFLKCYNDDNPIGLIDAPTISQVLRWLREEKKLYVGVTLHQYLDKSKFYPTIQRMNKMEQMMFVNNDVYSSYEEAALVGIEYVLDNLI